jgi:hypothetical protein
VGASGFAGWVRRFEDERERRRAQGDPGWERGATLHPAVWSSVQRFQAGEDGDGVSLVARLPAAGGAPTLTGHWSDKAFVRLRRLMGLRTELLVLMVAGVVALRYHRALRDGTGDPLTSDVAGRVLADEQRHVPFRCERLHASLAQLPRPLRRPVMVLWRLLLLAACLVVADHGPALRRLGPGRRRFVADVMASSRTVVSAILTPRTVARPDTQSGTRPGRA